METNIILSAVIFVLFGAIQVFVFQTCVNKIREIRRGEGDPNLKLRLLENEDNLFDMGLYIGIAGTALTLAVYDPDALLEYQHLRRLCLEHLWYPVRGPSQDHARAPRPRVPAD